MQESHGNPPNSPSDSEAQASLREIERRRERVMDEIGAPGWYWCGLAVAWIGLGGLADFGPAWLAFTATIVFCVGHSMVSRRYLAGRHRSVRLSVRDDVAGRHTSAMVGAGLFALVGLTALAAVVVSADGAGHPVLVASVIAAVVVVVGGPRVMAAIRRQAYGRAAFSK